MAGRRRKKPRVTTTALVLSNDPERSRLRELKATLGQRRDEIAELDLEIETLRGELADFELAYRTRIAAESEALKRVERVLLHFERWSELLREAPPGALPQRAERLEERRARELSARAPTTEAPPGTSPVAPPTSVTPEPAPPPAPQVDRLKVAYRALARRFHPDLARTEAERLEFSERMARINALYHDGDVDRLEVLAEQAKAGEVDEGLTAIGDQLALLEERLAWFDVVLENLRAERDALEHTPTCLLLREVERARTRRRDHLADIQRGLRARVETSYTSVRSAAHQLESEVKRFNRRPSALSHRQAEALARGFDPFGDKRLVRLGLQELKSLSVHPGARQLAERLQREGEANPAVLRLLLFASIAELSRFPLPGLERFEDISVRLEALARPTERHLTLERALVDADAWVEFGVRRATEHVVHLGLRFRTELAREAVQVMLQELPIRRELRRVLGVVGEREACPTCASDVFAVPLFRTHGLDDLRSLVCPRCGTALRSYWMPKGQDVQAVLNDAFLDFELVTEWSFRLGRGGFGVQLLPLQVEELDAGALKRRVYDDVFRRYGLELALEQVRLVQDGAAVDEAEPLTRLPSTSFDLRFEEGSPMRESEALELLRHRVRSRFRGG